MPNNPQIRPGASLEELEKAQQELRKQIEQKRVETRVATLNQIRKIISESALDIRDVVEDLSRDIRRRKAPAKYRNPENARQTWSGKGTPPHWYTAAEDKDALLISREGRRKR